MVKEFVRLRRKWFLVVLAVSFVSLIAITGEQYDSMIEILTFSFIGSLVVTTAISIISIPVVAMIVRKKRDG